MPDPAGIDLASIAPWLQEHVDAKPPLAFHRLPGGHSNLTYRVEDVDGEVFVLRRPPMGNLLPTAHDMAREYRIITGLATTSVPVARSRAFCEDRAITGAPFYVMDYVDGHVLHSAEIAESVYDDGQRRRAADSFIDVLADLHRVDPASVGLGDLGRQEGYVSRQLKRWYAQWQQSKTRELRAVDEVHDLLAAQIPVQGPARIVHGDYRLGNCLTSKTTGALLAVLDWEIATLGDSLADLGYVLATWSEPTDALPARGAPSLVAGFPSRAELLERYAARSGSDVSQIDFYICFSHWKGACISEGVYARYLEGALDTTGVDVEAFPAQVERMAALAQEVAGRL